MGKSDRPNPRVSVRASQPPHPRASERKNHCQHTLASGNISATPQGSVDGKSCCSSGTQGPPFPGGIWKCRGRVANLRASSQGISPPCSVSFRLNLAMQPSRSAPTSAIKRSTTGTEWMQLLALAPGSTRSRRSLTASVVPAFLIRAASPNTSRAGRAAADGATSNATNNRCSIINMVVYDDVSK